MLRGDVKKQLRVLPLFRDCFSLLDHWRMRRYFDKIGMSRLEERARQTLPLSVMKGPFAGLKLLSHACGSVWIPKILGCYEIELASAVEEIVLANPDVIVDVGCAEGYFAVGFACRANQARVVAADTNPVARGMVRKMAHLNHVGNRMETNGWITCQKLELLLAAANRPVVWCDIEGGEWELLDPLKVPSLRKARILVEDHRHITNLPSSELADRFSATHDCRFIEQSARNAADWIPQDWMTGLNRNDQELPMAELRPPGQKWIYMTPKAD